MSELSDMTTRQLERQVLQGDADALPLLKAAYVREGLDEEPRFWFLTPFPVSPESEPCVFKRHGDHDNADADRSWRTPARTVEEIMRLHADLSAPTPKGSQHHNRTHFAVYDEEEGRVIHVTSGMSDSVGGGLGRHIVSVGFLYREAFGKHAGPWSDKAIKQQAEFAKNLKKAIADHGGDVPWSWFVGELLRENRERALKEEVQRERAQREARS